MADRIIDVPEAETMHTVSTESASTREYAMRRPTSARKQSNLTISKSAVIITLMVIIGIGGFGGGMQYQKGKKTAASPTAASNFSGTSGQGGGFGGGSRGGFRMNGGIGTVSAISSTSISIAEQRTGTTKTYSISSSTTITDNGSTVMTSDIQTGDTVLVRTTSSTSTVATAITVNPSFGGGQGGASSDDSSASST